jgi:hypothetical protein
MANWEHAGDECDICGSHYPCHCRDATPEQKQSVERDNFIGILITIGLAALIIGVPAFLYFFYPTLR